MNKNLIITTTMEKWNDIISFNPKFLKRFIFRGQSDSNWKLSTSLERLINCHNPNWIDPAVPGIYESEMLADFKWRYPLYEKYNIPELEDNVEWLTLMQHYGCATRLLDFTRSIFVALFMALDNSFTDSSCIWALNKNIFTSKTFEIYRKEQNMKSPSSVPHSLLEQYSRDKANKLIGVIPINDIEKELLIINPKYCNERISIQQGLFIMPTDIRVSFDDCLTSFIKNCNPAPEEVKVKSKDLLDYSYDRWGANAQNDILFFKFEIPNNFKFKLTQLLNQMNITSETLYPGLVGMAKSLNSLRHNTGTYDE